MARRPLTENEKAAVIATVAGLLMLLSGITGASQWRRTFDFIEEFLGANLLLRFVQFVLVTVGSLGGGLVLLGAYAFREDRVRTGKLLIWLGTGCSVFGVVLHFVLVVRHGEAVFASGALLGLAGILLTIVARFRARAKPLRS